MKEISHTARFKGVEHSHTFKNICELFGLQHIAVLDIGCGFGQYLEHFGKGSVGVTTTEEEVEFGRKNNLKIVLGNAERLDNSIGEHFKAIWANNLFEHLLSPHAFLMNLKKFSKADTIAIVGVPVVPKVVSLANLRWWRGTLASNHVNFFTHSTLRLTVERAGWEVSVARPFIFKNLFLDILARPWSPHIYIVAKNKANFKYPEKKVKEWIGDSHYASLLAITGQDEK